MKKLPVSFPREVIDAIGEELEYQFRVSGTDRADDTDNGVAGQLVTLNALVQQMNQAWYSNAGDHETLDLMRKAAATCVRTMVLYGTVRREMPEPVGPDRSACVIIRVDDPRTERTTFTLTEDDISIQVDSDWFRENDGLGRLLQQMNKADWVETGPWGSRKLTTCKQVWIDLVTLAEMKADAENRD